MKGNKKLKLQPSIQSSCWKFNSINIFSKIAKKAALNFYSKSRFSVKPSKFPIYFAHDCSSAKLKICFSRKCTSFEEQKGTKVYSRKCLFWYYRLQLSLVYKVVSRICFNLFRSRGKRFLSDIIRKWGWFHRHDVRFPENLGSRWKFQKNLGTVL